MCFPPVVGSIGGVSGVCAKGCSVGGTMEIKRFFGWPDGLFKTFTFLRTFARKRWNGNLTKDRQREPEGAHTPPSLLFVQSILKRAAFTQAFVREYVVLYSSENIEKSSIARSLRYKCSFRLVFNYDRSLLILLLVLCLFELLITVCLFLFLFVTWTPQRFT